jgi:hypothetical protein
MTTFKGTFNWYGQDIVLWTTAFSIKQAFRYMCQRLSQQLQVSPYRVRVYFNNTTKYEIKEES